MFPTSHVLRFGKAAKLVIFLLLLSSTALAASPLTCPAVVNEALTQLGDRCGELERNIACYGNNNVQAAFNADFTQTMPTAFFSQPSDQTDITPLEQISTSSLDLELNEWGIAVLKLQADVANTLPGQLVTFLLLGNVNVENAGRGTMQSFYLSTGIGPPRCEDVTDNVLMVQTPHGMTVDLDVNGAHLEVGSTILLRILPPGDIMELIVLEGRVVIPNGGAANEDIVVLGRERAYVCLSNGRDLGMAGDNDDREVICPWAKAERLSQYEIDQEWCYLERVPASVLTYAINIGCSDPAVPEPAPVGAAPSAPTVEVAPAPVVANPPPASVTVAVVPPLVGCNGVNGAFQTIVLAGSPYGGARDTDVPGNIYATNPACDEEIHGTNFNDTIIDGNDRIFGYAGDDTIIAGAGNDTIDGGTGFDTYDASADTAGVTINLTDPLLVTISGASVGNDTATAVEVFIPGSGSDTFVLGPAPAFTLAGGAGANTYQFGSGASGTFIINSTSGLDILDFAGLGVGIVLDLTIQGVDQAVTGTLTINLTGAIRQVILPDTAGVNSTVTGDNQANIITGGAGDDTINGGGGDDNLTGAGGIDTIHGDAGNDTIDGGAGSDAIYGNDGSDIIEGGADDDALYGGGLCTADAAPDMITDMGNSPGDQIYGGSLNVCAIISPDGNDTITDDNVGTGGVIYGGNNNTLAASDDGNDLITVLSATGGAIYGGNSNNESQGADGSDTINIHNAQGLAIFGGNNNFNPTGSGNDGGDVITVQGGQNNQIFGGNVNAATNTGTDSGDTITLSGGTNNNTVFGGNYGNQTCPALACDDTGSDTLIDTSGQANRFFGGHNDFGGATVDNGDDNFQVADGGAPDIIFTGNNNTLGGTATESGQTAVPGAGDAVDGTDNVTNGNNP
jgi:hypothetical protein